MKIVFLSIVIFLSLSSCAQQSIETLVTIADARNHPAQIIDTGDSGDSMGDILVFDQPLLDKNMKPIGTNSGSCIRTRIAHSFQCQWTLSTKFWSIQVAGREFDEGISTISILGGTGTFVGISGEMKSTNNNDGTFTQVLRYRILNK